MALFTASRLRAISGLSLALSVGCVYVPSGHDAPEGYVDLLTSDQVNGVPVSGERRSPLVNAPDGTLFGVNGTPRVFVSDGSGPWGSVDLAPYAGSGSFGVITGARLGQGVLLGTGRGVAWLSASDGTTRWLGGLPASTTVLAIAALDEEHALVGLPNVGSTGPPRIFRCVLSSFECALSNDGVTSASTYSSVNAFLVQPGAGLVFAATNTGLFRSFDRGVTWAPSANGLPAIRVNRIVGSQGALVAGTQSGCFRSEDLGGSWSLVTDGLPATFDLRALGGAGATLFAGVGTDVYRSGDSGRSWGRVSSFTPGSMINVLAATGRGVYAATSAGVFRSVDGGTTWERFSRGLHTASVSAFHAAGGTVFAGTFGNRSGVYRTTDGGATWQPSDATLNDQWVRPIAALGSTVVAGTTTGSVKVFRSLDGGATWTPSPAGGIASNDGLSVLTTAGSAFLAGLRLGAVARSTDGGVSWSPSRSGLPAGNLFVNAIASRGSTVVIGTSNAVHRSTDAGASWRPGGTVPFTAPFSVVSLYFSASGALFASAHTSDFQNGGVFASTDEGASWRRIDNGLIAGPIFAVAAAPSATVGIGPPSAGDVVFAAGVAGVWVTADDGASWKPFVKEHNATPVTALAVSGNTLFSGSSGLSVVSTPLPPRAVRLVPIVLDVPSGSARFTSELALTNRGATDARVTLLYTAALSTGTGTATDVVRAGSQTVIPDVIGYLRAKGVPIPDSGPRAGTLLVTFDGISSADAVAVTARTGSDTAAPQPGGRSGLAYGAIDPLVDAVEDSLVVYGLRSDASDRSNLAVFNAGATPVTVKVTAFSGTGDGRSVVVDGALQLPPYGWAQINGVLAAAQMSNGFVRIERVSPAGAFSAYGVVNDNGTNDGSYIVPTAKRSGLDYLNVPVLVETPSFRSELVLANSSAAPVTLTLRYVETLNDSGGAGGSTALTLAPGEQRIIPEAIAFLRQRGLAIGAAGGSYAGSLHVGVAGALVNDVFAGARTASRSPAAGQFGVFTPAFTPGSEAVSEAFLYGLRADATNRSNVAVANTALSGDPITLELQAYDGDAGGAPRGAPFSVTLGPGRWTQVASFLGTQGVRNGWVRVKRTAGTSPWIAYGVVNDGGNPGERTGDGAYVPMVR